MNVLWKLTLILATKSIVNTDEESLAARYTHSSHSNAIRRSAMNSAVNMILEEEAGDLDFEEEITMTEMFRVEASNMSEMSRKKVLACSSLMSQVHRWNVVLMLNLKMRIPDFDVKTLKSLSRSKLVFSLKLLENIQNSTFYHLLALWQAAEHFFEMLTGITVGVFIVCF